MSAIEIVVTVVLLVLAYLGLGYAYNYLHMLHMMRDLSKRLPQTPEEWEAEHAKDEQFFWD